MTDTAPRASDRIACPYLGLESDPASYASSPDASHRCRATLEPTPIETAHQAWFCLMGTHLDCPRFLQAEEREVERVRVSALGVRTGREAERLGRGPWLLQAVTRLLAVVIVLTIVAAGAAYVVGDGVGLAGLGGSAPQAALSPGATLVANPSAVASATPVVSVAPPSPTPRSKNVIYAVRQGDTLEKIAAQFGVTIDDIVSANKLKDPNRLTIGQKLVIPPPPEPPAGY